MLANYFPSTRAPASAGDSCSGFRPAVGLHNRLRRGFVAGAIAALVVALPCALFAQSPLTVQPSTGRVGIGNTNPSEALDVTGTVKATAFQGDGSQLTNIPQNNSAEPADVQIFTTPGTAVWFKPANAKQVFAYLIGGGGGGALKNYPWGTPGNGMYRGGDGGGSDGEGTSGGVSVPGAGGGGAGATLISGTAQATSGGGAGAIFRGTPLAGGAGGASGTAPTEGGAGTSATVNEGSGGGGGGGGGARPSSGPSAAGGNGGNYGGGGGGGGASVNGQLSGKGGDGASGIAIIVTLF